MARATKSDADKDEKQRRLAEKLKQNLGRRRDARASAPKPKAIKNVEKF